MKDKENTDRKYFLFLLRNFIKFKLKYHPNDLLI